MDSYSCEYDYIHDMYKKRYKKLVNKWVKRIRKEIISSARNGYDRVYTFIPSPVAEDVARYFQNEKFSVSTKPYMDGREYSIKIKWE